MSSRTVDSGGKGTPYFEGSFGGSNYVVQDHVPTPPPPPTPTSNNHASSHHTSGIFVYQDPESYYDGTNSSSNSNSRSNSGLGGDGSGGIGVHKMRPRKLQPKLEENIVLRDTSNIQPLRDSGLQLDQHNPVSMQPGPTPTSVHDGFYGLVDTTAAAYDSSVVGIATSFDGYRQSEQHHQSRQNQPQQQQPYLQQPYLQQQYEQQPYLLQQYQQHLGFLALQQYGDVSVGASAGPETETPPPAGSLSSTMTCGHQHHYITTSTSTQQHGRRSPAVRGHGDKMLSQGVHIPLIGTAHVDPARLCVRDRLRSSVPDYEESRAAAEAAAGTLIFNAGDTSSGLNTSNSDIGSANTSLSSVESATSGIQMSTVPIPPHERSYFADTSAASAVATISASTSAAARDSGVQLYDMEPNEDSMDLDISVQSQSSSLEQQPPLIGTGAHRTNVQRPRSVVAMPVAADRGRYTLAPTSSSAAMAMCTSDGDRHAWTAIDGQPSRSYPTISRSRRPGTPTGGGGGGGGGLRSSPFLASAKKNKRSKTPKRAGVSPRPGTPQQQGRHTPSQKMAATPSASRTPQPQRRRQGRSDTPVRTPSRTPLRNPEPESDWDKNDYKPFLGCRKPECEHPHCILRKSFTVEAIEQGKYACYQQGVAGAPPTARAEQLQLPGKLLGDTLRVERVEELIGGRQTLMQLHLYRCHEAGPRSFRPLLHPDCDAAPTIKKLLTHNKMFCGVFFEEKDGTRTCSECVLVNFPHGHREAARQQMKIWDVDSGKISCTQDQNDIKAQMLTYMCWLYGRNVVGEKEKMSRWPSEGLKKWPQKCEGEMECTGTCDFSRIASSRFRHPAFLCINPMCYYQDEADKEAMKAHIHTAITTCYKDESCLPGEKPRPGSDGKSRCYCLSCRRSSTIRPTE